METMAMAIADEVVMVTVTVMTVKALIMVKV